MVMVNIAIWFWFGCASAGTAELSHQKNCHVAAETTSVWLFFLTFSLRHLFTRLMRGNYPWNVVSSD